jgi:RNA polymerase-binding transcription factor DksA
LPLNRKPALTRIKAALREPPKLASELEDMMTSTAKRKHQLEQRLADLGQRLGGIEAELTGHDEKDWEEQATEREGDEVLEQMGMGSQTEIRAIKAALQRIEDGSYGNCLRCGEPIEAARLDLLPFTPFCKDHAT